MFRVNLQLSSQLVAFKGEDGSVMPNGTEIANILNNFFGSYAVFTNEHLAEVPSLPVKFSDLLYSSVDVSIAIILCKLKSGDPDGCHPSCVQRG